VGIGDGIAFTEPWVGVLLWVGLYTSDYLLTLASARLLQAGADQHFGLGGGLELTPYYRADVGAIRWLSPRFLAALVGSSLGLLIVGALSRAGQETTELYAVLLGAMLCLELAVHVRHVRNLALFRLTRLPGAVKGRVEIPRWVSLKHSSAEFLAFAGVYGPLGLISWSPFLLGGALTCLSTGITHERWARQEAAPSQGRGLTDR
jgi:hypothetical protein